MNTVSNNLGTRKLNNKNEYWRGKINTLNNWVNKKEHERIQGNLTFHQIDQKEEEKKLIAESECRRRKKEKEE